MTDIAIRTDGRAGRITLTRPRALNALTHQMCLDIEAALLRWRDDDAVALVVIDAEGEKAFCAGGDIAQVQAAGKAGDYSLGRDFWRDEYRMNALLSSYPKPIFSFMQGFVMGGGVGLGCHVGYRVVGDTTQMAMPECGIGLIPDVGGTLLLSAAPGHLGEYLGLTGARMGAGDAIAAGFADHWLSEADWPQVIAALCASDDPAALPRHAPPAPTLPRAEIDATFGADTVPDIIAAVTAAGGDFADAALRALGRGAPLSMACTLRMLRAQRGDSDIRNALRREFRFTWRSMDKGDFIEGVRAQIIDKDRAPRWQHASADAVSEAEVAAMLAPLGADELDFGEDAA